MIAKLFLPGFLSLIASLKATEDASSLFQYSQLVLLLHFHDRHASYSCLVAVPTALAKCYSPGYFLLYSKFKTISVTGRPTSICFQFISLAGRFAESYFAALLTLNIISVVDHLAPRCYLVELFSRLIATLRVVLVECALKIQDKTSIGKNCLRYSIQNGFCR